MALAQDNHLSVVGRQSEGTMGLVGYARVSSREDQQVFDRQVDALKAAGCERVFEDRGSGASMS